VGNRVEHNTYDGNTGGGSGIYLENISGPSHFDLDRNWIAYNNGITGTIYLINNTYFTLTNNVIAHNFDHGLYLDNVGSSALVNNNTIANNAGSGIFLNASTMFLKNSILANNGRFGLEVYAFFSPAQVYNDAWNNAWGPTNDQAVLFDLLLNPRFFDSASAKYGLLPDSPCMDEASLISYDLNSFNGVLRPQGFGPDIGALEMLQYYLPMLRK